MVTAIQRTNADMLFGTYGDIEKLAKRIKLMVKGGEKLADNEALALAQIVSVTHLNPFIGEIWYIPGKGPMVGIAGARRLDQEQAASNGGYSFATISVCSPQEAGATEKEIKENVIVAAFRVVINDTAATAEYQKLLTSTLTAMRDAGVPDPFGAAKEVCGPRPEWVGYGYSKTTDQSTMNKMQLARKRAEADGLKKRIIVPFGGNVAETEINPDYVDAQAVDVQPEVRRTKEQNLSDLGFSDAPKPAENINQETGSEERPIELIDPMSDWAVQYAAKKWNVENGFAAQEIGKKKLGKRIDKQEFIQIVRGEVPA
jgi:hypothetical protein